MDLDGVADELYGISPEEFIERRTELVAEAKQAGDRELAKQIGQLRRPTRTAWMVNLLARNNHTEIEEFLDLGPALADAQQRGAGDDLRNLSKQRRTAVDSLTRLAVDLAEAAGYAPNETTVQEVSSTLQAGLSDPEVAESTRQGRLTQAASYGGFGPAMPTADSAPDLLAALAASASAGKDQKKGGRAKPEEVTADDQERLKAQEQLDEATRAWEEAISAANEAAEAADRATTHAEELADKIDELRAQLRQAESEERDARTEARAARKHAQQLRQSATAAEARRTALRDKLG